MEFSQMGYFVQVLFDETIVKFNWLDLRKFEIIDIILASKDKETVQALQKLADVDEEEDVNELLEKLDQMVVADDSIIREQPEA